MAPSQDRSFLILSHLSSRMLQLHSQIQDLSKLNKQLSEFNRVFASFLLSLQLTSTGVKIGYVQPKLQAAQFASPISDKQDIPIQPPQLLSEVTHTEAEEAIHPPSNGMSIEKVAGAKAKKSNVGISSKAQTRSSSTSFDASPTSLSMQQQKKDQAVSTTVKKVCLSLPLHMRTPGCLAEAESIIRFLTRSPAGE